MVDWLIDWLFNALRPGQNISRHHYQTRAAKIRLMVGAYGLWAEKGPSSWHIRGDTGPSLAFRVSSEGPTFSVALHNKQREVEDLFQPGSSQVPYQSPFMTYKKIEWPILTQILGNMSSLIHYISSFIRNVLLIKYISWLITYYYWSHIFIDKERILIDHVYIPLLIRYI
jgi:hypothetical protein